MSLRGVTSILAMAGPKASYRDLIGAQKSHNEFGKAACDEHENQQADRGPIMSSNLCGSETHARFAWKPDENESAGNDQHYEADQDITIHLTVPRVIKCRKAPPHTTPRKIEPNSQHVWVQVAGTKAPRSKSKKIRVRIAIDAACTIENLCRISRHVARQLSALGIDGVAMSALGQK